MPTTGSTITGDIAQGGLFALSMVRSRPTRCRRIHWRPHTYQGIGGDVPAKVWAKENRPHTFRDPPPLAFAIGSMPAQCAVILAAANLYLPLQYLAPGNKGRGNRPFSARIEVGLCRIVGMKFREPTI